MLAGAGSNSVARTGSSAARSNAYRGGLATSARPGSAAATGRTVQLQCQRPPGRMSWYGLAVPAGKTVRSGSCRADHVAQRRLQRVARPASPVSRSGQRDVVGRARARPAGRGTTAGAARTTAARARAVPRRAARRARPVRDACPSRAASPATVGASNSVRSGSSTPSTARIRRHQPDGQQRVPAEREEVVVDADRLAGPAPRRTPRTAAPPAPCAGARPARRRRTPARAAPGGRACRWRSAAAPASTTTAAGTMYSGSRSATNSRSARRPSPAAATT